MAKDNNQEFAKILRDQLYEETFCASVSEYSPERVQLLVKLIDGEEKTDESEATASYDNFIARFGALEQTLEQEKKRRKQKFAPLRFAKGAVAAIALILVANITTYAVMDTSIFHIVTTAVNQGTVLPTSSEADDMIEQEIAEYFQVDDFARVFGTQFQFCGWLPEEVQLQYISRMRMDGICYYDWHYGISKSTDILNVKMFEKTQEDDYGGLVGNELENEQTTVLSNNLLVTMLDSQDMSVAGFECNGWWYIVSYVGEKETLTKILEGMVLYE